MKNRVKIVVISVFLIIFIAVLTYFLIVGSVRTDVYLGGFELSPDGKKMTLKVGVSSSAGYIRKMKITSGSMNHYYTFYSTFGINSKIGAKNNFEIDIDENVDEIYFYTGNKGYKLVLIKSEDTGEWVKLKYKNDRIFKLDLTSKKDIVKVSISKMSQNDNYFEYTDKNIIDNIYDVFNDLETEVVSKTFNPKDTEEMYMVSFFDDSSEDAIIDTYVEIYKKDGKYYVEQRYNGIYEITEDKFNLVKSYIK